MPTKKYTSFRQLFVSIVLQANSTAPSWSASKAQAQCFVCRICPDGAMGQAASQYKQQQEERGVFFVGCIADAER